MDVRGSTLEGDLQDIVELHAHSPQGRSCDLTARLIVLLTLRLERCRRSALLGMRA
jgi:hypothetical protein